MTADSTIPQARKKGLVNLQAYSVSLGIPPFESITVVKHDNCRLDFCVHTLYTRINLINHNYHAKRTNFPRTV